ncbi:predicted protein [Chaetomium globosum CBS 148.51]|uniref:Uncharacterized protein n=1 Tax=Chaetomium globosum (strain ATCC 6205 / CBS 148.51 / DSM 1962 / NBRC 6347 / NRRL 1970) TaxID=306901 RepID=Q2GYF6_CHAGB|nr:uncharacterized protein CHGG_06998 [Chaetomium globosum CBS 148.51]EAQ85745.1 predicted protein [Chaetomium globosum CBS 148.51]
MAPVAAFTMAGLLFFYTRSSIRAARRNAILYTAPGFHFSTRTIQESRSQQTSSG